MTFWTATKRSNPLSYGDMDTKFSNTSSNSEDVYGGEGGI